MEMEKRSHYALPRSSSLNRESCSPFLRGQVPFFSNLNWTKNKVTGLRIDTIQISPPIYELKNLRAPRNRLFSPCLLLSYHTFSAFLLPRDTLFCSVTLAVPCLEYFALLLVPTTTLQIPQGIIQYSDSCQLRLNS